MAGKYGFCRLKAQSNAVKKGEPPDFTKCDDKYSFKWQQAETIAGTGVCPSEGDETAIQDFITQHSDDIAAALAGGPRFVDNADGTITDNETGLTWEKKVELGGGSNFANPHAADNTYVWAGFCSILISKHCQPTAAAAALCAANSEGGGRRGATSALAGTGRAARSAPPGRWRPT